MFSRLFGKLSREEAKHEHSGSLQQHENQQKRRSLTNKRRSQESSGIPSSSHQQQQQQQQQQRHNVDPRNSDSIRTPEQQENVTSNRDQQLSKTHGKDSHSSKKTTRSGQPLPVEEKIEISDDPKSKTPNVDINTITIIQRYTENTLLGLDNKGNLIMVTVTNSEKLVTHMKIQAEILRNLNDDDDPHNHNIIRYIAEKQLLFKDLPPAAAAALSDLYDTVDSEAFIYIIMIDAAAIPSSNQTTTINNPPYIYTLRDFIDSKYQVTERESIEYMRQLCEALKHLQNCDVAHLNIDPVHIFVNIETRQVSLGGFLCAQQRGGDGILLLDQVSPVYRAPELFEGATQTSVIDPSVDVWSMGAVCFELISKEKTVWSPHLLENEQYFNIDCYSVRDDFPHLFSVLSLCLTAQPSLRASIPVIIRSLSHKAQTARSTILDSLSAADHFRDDRVAITKAIRMNLLKYASQQRNIGNRMESISVLQMLLEMQEDSEIRMQFSKECGFVAEQLLRDGDLQKALNILRNAVPTPEIRELQQRIEKQITSKSQ